MSGYEDLVNQAVEKGITFEQGYLYRLDVVVGDCVEDVLCYVDPNNEHTLIHLNDWWEGEEVKLLKCKIYRIATNVEEV